MTVPAAVFQQAVAISEGFCWKGHRLSELDPIEQILAESMVHPVTGWCGTCNKYYGLYVDDEGRMTGVSHASRTMVLAHRRGSNSKRYVLRYARHKHVTMSEF